MLPVAEDIRGGVGFAVAEDVRMAADHFVVDLADDGGDVEAALFLSDLGVKKDLEKKVPEFFCEFGVVGGIKSVEDFVSFFDEVGAESGVRLFAVPGAAAGGTEARHDRDEFLEVGADLGRCELGVARHAFLRFTFEFLFGHRIYFTEVGEVSEGGRTAKDYDRGRKSITLRNSRKGRGLVRPLPFALGGQRQEHGRARAA